MENWAWMMTPGNLKKKITSIFAHVFFLLSIKSTKPRVLCTRRRNSETCFEPRPASRPADKPRIADGLLRFRGLLLMGWIRTKPTGSGAGQPVVRAATDSIFVVVVGRLYCHTTYSKSRALSTTPIICVLICSYSHTVVWMRIRTTCY